MVHLSFVKFHIGNNILKWMYCQEKFRISIDTNSTDPYKMRSFFFLFLSVGKSFCIHEPMIEEDDVPVKENLEK